MIELKDFSIGYKGNILLENINTTFRQNQLTAFIGRNGSGKSTLMKAICGLNEKYSGDIIIDGENIKSISKHGLSTLISYVNTQRPRIENMKCRGMVSLGRSPHTNWHGNLSNHDKEIVSISLEKVGMSEYSERYFNSLSDGEAQKIMIARAIAQDTPIILLDEPTSFLDLPSRIKLAQLLKELTENDGKTIIFSTHELDLALKYSDNIVLFDNPNLINLPTKEMQTSNHLTQLFS